MTNAQIEKVAEMLESTWSKYYYKKDHKCLVGTLLTLMADCEFKTVIDIIKDYANNYDNAPNVATISKLAHKPAEVKSFPARNHPKYFEDSDGCGYLWNEKEKDYDCIWKYWWAEQGKSKMATLREHGVIDY